VQSEIISSQLLQVATLLKYGLPSPKYLPTNSESKQLTDFYAQNHNKIKINFVYLLIPRLFT